DDRWSDLGVVIVRPSTIWERANVVVDAWSRKGGVKSRRVRDICRTIQAKVRMMLKSSKINQNRAISDTRFEIYIKRQINGYFSSAIKPMKPNYQKIESSRSILVIYPKSKSMKKGKSKVQGPLLPNQQSIDPRTISANMGHFFYKWE
nr:hypothetical protein [Tanacetum cinerariifolium]